MKRYFCCSERRRNDVRDPASGLNGIDFLEVVDEPSDPIQDRQRFLRITFLKPLTPTGQSGALAIDNVHVTGGDRIRDITAIAITIGTGPDDHLMTVEVDRPGDFSTYTLELIRDPDDLDTTDNPPPPEGFDPILSAIDFSFKVSCPSEFDCQPDHACQDEPPIQPQIDYLAKDYNSFRSLMLDRLSTLMPDWQARNPADLGVTLVELLAYVGDYLSYQQDAVASEAYLDTARRRVSVRRHARLLDYFMHDGCNSRSWVHVHVAEGVADTELAASTPVFTRVPEMSQRITTEEFQRGWPIDGRPIIFETMHPIQLFSAHNEMHFYTWGDEKCCLPRGATRAWLRNEGNRLANLSPGDILIFEEIRDPKTGQRDDADPQHRQAVRLTSVMFSEDPLYREPDDPAQPMRVVDIRWSPDDALLFPLCLDEVRQDPDDPASAQPVSIALGNIVLADHGQSLTTPEDLGTVPQPSLYYPPKTGSDRCAQTIPQPVRPRFRPVLKEGPVTQAELYTATTAPSASGAIRRDPSSAVPTLQLASTGPDEVQDNWVPQRDLLSSGPDQRHYVLEVESDGTAMVRFGDDRFGLRPNSGTSFEATYRVGNGPAGNVEPETLVHIVSNDDGIQSVRNPLPSSGGVDPEQIDEVRQRAPVAFRTQQRAVTPEDYAAQLTKHPEVQQAVGGFRWTGSWRTVFLAVDRINGHKIDIPFEQRMRRYLEPVRMAGHDLEIHDPSFVPIELELQVCVAPDFFRSDVKEELLMRFSNRTLADGQRGVFHPDNFTFGQTVYLSPLIAAAGQVDGVESVQALKFQRQGDSSTSGIDSGQIPLEPLEIAQLGNDPNYPDRGVFRMIMGGGK